MIKGFIISLIILIVGSLSGILRGFDTDISSLKTWKVEHQKLDDVQFNIIQGQLEKLNNGQKEIYQYLLNKNK